MTLDELILQDIDNKPVKKQTESEKQLYDALKEKEYYRKDAIYWEQRAKRFEAAYNKMKEEKRKNEKAESQEER